MRVISKRLNHSFLQLECEKDIAYELREHFTIWAKNYKWAPAYKAKAWDGKLRLFDIRNNTIRAGLFNRIQQFCYERDYEFIGDNNSRSYALNEAVHDVNRLKLPFSLHDHQIKSYLKSIRNFRLLLLSPTSSGKSLITYMLMQKFLQDNLKTLIIVPLIGLQKQLITEFEEYAQNIDFDPNDYMHLVGDGQNIRETNKPVTLTTWQSFSNNTPLELLLKFKSVIVDEAHFAKSKSITTILDGCANAFYRIGMTGTIEDTNTDKLTLEGLTGPIYQTISTAEMRDKGIISDFEVKCLILKHKKRPKKKPKEYSEEIDFLFASEERNEFIKNLALSLEGNTLILFRKIEKHGHLLNDLLKECGRKVFYIHGGIPTQDREAYRKIVEKETNAIVLASEGTFSTGISIKHLHNIIKTSSSKSKILNLQGIGRGLRRGENKSFCTILDIADDLGYSEPNHTLKHFEARLKIYHKEDFKVKVYNIDLEPKGIKNGSNSRRNSLY